MNRANDQDDKEYFCNECGTDVGIDDKVCSKCGANLEGPIQQPQENHNQSRTFTHRIAEGGLPSTPNDLKGPFDGILSFLFGLSILMIVIGVFILIATSGTNRLILFFGILLLIVVLLLEKIASPRFFEVKRPNGDGRCSDDKCPCPGDNIPRGSGYLYISKDAISFRRNCPTIQQLEEKVSLIQSGSTFFIPDKELVGPILMCEQGAKLRGINLEVASTDAEYWWDTGLVPFTATPLQKH